MRNNKELEAKRLLEVAKKTFRVEKDLSLQTGPDEIHSWDSLGNINLIIAIEEEFDIEFEEEELMELQTLGAILEIILKKHDKNSR